jgi:hypothetical protein
MRAANVSQSDSGRNFDEENCRPMTQRMAKRIATEPATSQPPFSPVFPPFEVLSLRARLDLARPTGSNALHRGKLCRRRAQEYRLVPDSGLGVVGEVRRHAQGRDAGHR